MESSPFPSSSTVDPAIELMQSGYRYALSLTHHAQDAEDLLQEAWLNLCRRYGAVSSRAALYTAIRNLFIDRCRRNRVIAFDSLENVDALAETFHGVSAGTVDDMEILLGQLRPGEREVIFLHHIEGRTAEEIGVMTGQPRGTVLSLLHRALKKLRLSVAAPR